MEHWTLAAGLACALMLASGVPVASAGQGDAGTCACGTSTHSIAAADAGQREAGGCPCGASILALAGPSQEQGTKPGEKKETPLPLPKCPVMGNPINFAVSVATDDGPVFFCCKGCIPKYEAEPEKYAEKVAAQRKALADRPKVQVLCPVSGEPVDPKVFIEHDGAKVYFCCKGCIEKFQKGPEKYKAALANSFTYQTKCPVTGNAIDPQARVGKIYFCCKNCPKKFFADPAKYAPNLEAQGFKFDPADMKHGEEGTASAPDAHGPHGHGQTGHDHDH